MGSRCCDSRISQSHMQLDFAQVVGLNLIVSITGGGSYVYDPGNNYPPPRSIIPLHITHLRTSQFQTVTYNPSYMIIVGNWTPRQLRRDTWRQYPRNRWIRMEDGDLRITYTWCAMNKFAANAKGNEFKFPGLTSERTKSVKTWWVRETVLSCCLSTSSVFSCRLLRHLQAVSFRQMFFNPIHKEFLVVRTSFLFDVLGSHKSA